MCWPPSLKKKAWPDMGENAPVFDEEIRTELMSMFTGMALQGLAPLRGTVVNISLGRDAVDLAEAAVQALEEYHLRRKDELIAQRRAVADISNIVGSTL